MARSLIDVETSLSPIPIKMMHWTVARSRVRPDRQPVGRADRRGDVALRRAGGFDEAHTLRQSGGNRRRQRTAGAVGAARGKARRDETLDAVGIDQEIDALGARRVTAL